MTDLEQIELHDGIITRFSIDFENGSASIFAKAYLDPKIRSRSNIEIVFLGVENISSILDLIALKNNSRAGNINYSIVGEKGDCYLYLQDGCIKITSLSREVKILN